MHASTSRACIHSGNGYLDLTGTQAIKLFCSYLFNHYWAFGLATQSVPLMRYHERFPWPRRSGCGTSSIEGRVRVCGLCPLIMSNANHNERMRRCALSPLLSREVFAPFPVPSPSGRGYRWYQSCSKQRADVVRRKFSQEVLHMLYRAVTAVSLGTEEGGP